MRGWKQVDQADAHYLEAGSLKLGTWDDYRTLENGRGDEYDASVVVHSGVISGHGPGAYEAFRRLGHTDAEARSMTAPHVHYLGEMNRTITTVSPMYAFCVAEVGCDYDPSPAVPKAIFEVAGLHTLAARLRELHPDRLGRHLIRRVAYAKVEIQAQSTEAIPRPSPFLKGQKFSVEREIRLVFLPVKRGPISTLYTTADKQVEALLRRRS